jgi:Zn-dependent protease
MEFFQTGGMLYSLATWALPVLLAITLHEAAHGWAADKLGDPTARLLGRVSFNPVRHVEVFGTLLLPGFLLLTGAPFLFGWAKPVPVNFRNLRNPRRDMVFVAAAGPAANFLIALAAAFMLHIPFWMEQGEASQFLARMLINMIQLNLVLMLFNLIPLPPLDGGRIAVGLLPDFLAVPLARLERFGMLLLILGMLVLPLINSDWSLFALLHQPLDWMADLLVRMAGLV